MVEIDYYSKYLKYKQKYLKQKNLQIGGDNVKIEIKIADNPNVTNLWLTCNEDYFIDTAIKNLLFEKKINYKNYTLQYKEGPNKDWNNLYITKDNTFIELCIKEGTIKVIIQNESQ